MASEGSFLIANSNKLERASNYWVCKIKMRTILREKKLWHYIYSKEARIIVELGEVTLKMEQERRDKTSILIILSLKDNVSKSDDLVVCWDTLKNIFKARNGAKTLHFSNKLENIKMIKGSTTKNFIKRRKELVVQLASVGDVVLETRFVQIMLGALSKSYNVFF